MTLGPGKYDSVCTMASELTGAHTVVLIILEGSRGTGFSMQTADPTFERALPAVLRSMADEIERDLNGRRS